MYPILRFVVWAGVAGVCLGGRPSASLCQTMAARPGEFLPGLIQRLDQVPPGRFRTNLERLDPAIRDRALRKLAEVHLTRLDFETLHLTSHGELYVVDPVPELSEPVEDDPNTPPVGGGSLPLSPFPEELHFHSRPGAPNVLYLDFDGEVVRNTWWNEKVNRDSIPAVPFDTDGDTTTFSAAEQLTIFRAWQRVAEDFAPFHIDVTTQRPSSLGDQVGHVLITRNVDANGDPNPSTSAGGTATLNVFGQSNYAYNRPAWVYFNHLASREDYISEAVSHEFGHNLGLTHDGTSSSGYYGGHGTGETSWGPIMGTSYGRNLSQWSKGEYYEANNTQNDLAVIAGKLSYRGDDHGNSIQSATPLVLSQGTNIFSTVPDTDPENISPANKGVLERNDDVDVFSFTAGDGLVVLEVLPYPAPAYTRGCNLDVSLELYDSAARRLLTDGSEAQPEARLETPLSEGIYYLYVRNDGDGSPASATPTGYTAYGSIGQYYIRGTLTKSDFVIPPQASLQVTDVDQAGAGPKRFTVTYTDNAGIDVSSIEGLDIRVTGPAGYGRNARFVTVNASTDGSPRVATYEAVPPNGTEWLGADAGVYEIQLQAGQVMDIEGESVPARALGEFRVAIPQAIYVADMDEDPGWTLQSAWEYGRPIYESQGPTSGLTGENVVGYNLDGDYENRLTIQYATTPKINVAGTTTLTLRFRRWLRLRNNDEARIEVSVSGTSWTEIWSTTQPISDSEWREVQYPLPGWTAGSASLQIRWGLASGPAQTDIGWNIDDLEIIGDGNLDTTPPGAVLSVTDVTAQGGTNHIFTVSWSDDTAVRVSSLDSADVRVMGPNGFVAQAALISVNDDTDGSPRVATYGVAAPGGVWEAVDNGTYDVIVLGEEVEDIRNNAIPETVLGSFAANIPPSQQRLMVTPSSLEVGEGAAASFTVQLFEAPLVPYPITVTKLSGDPDLVMIGEATHEFNPGNWLTAFQVNVEARRDIDKENGFAVFECSAPGLVPVTVLAMERDDTVDVGLVIQVNNEAWGSVSHGGGTFPSGTTIQVEAVPLEFFRFVEWRLNDTVTSLNPLSLQLWTNVVVEAVFAEVLTLNHPTPHWWLVAHGFNEDFESAVDLMGANGVEVWKSYVAGLDPRDPASRFRLFIQHDSQTRSTVLHWSPIENRLYTIWRYGRSSGERSVIATHLDWSIRSYTNAWWPDRHQDLFYLEVTK